MRQKHYLYHLSEACKWGRDIIWEQNCEFNLPIRKIVENILENHREQSREQWQQFVVYAKRLFFSNGIHHHYSHDKFYPECDREYFIKLMLEADCSKYPLGNMSLEDYCRKMAGIIYDSDIAPKRKEMDKGKDPIEGSAVNFYKGLNRQEVEDFYAAMKPSDPMRPPATGLNSKLVKQNGQIKELTYRMGGLYGKAIEKIVENLRKAMAFAENEQQQKYTEVLIEYYTSGDLELWDKYNILWLEEGIVGDDTDGHIDDITRFVSPNTVVTAVETNPKDENYQPLQRNLELLKEMRDQEGNLLNVVEIPMPEPVYYDGQRLPASYANFYIANHAVIVPTYRCSRDVEVLGILKELFPDREVVGIDSTDLIWGLGSFHCISQQEPL